MQDPTENRRPTGFERLRPKSSPAAAAGVLVAGIAVVLPVYLAIDRDLSGLTLLAALALAATSLLLLLESTQRARGRSPWRVAASLGVAFGLGSLGVVVVPSNSAAVGALRIAAQDTAPELFTVALRQAVSLPAPTDGWEQLHDRGAVDVYGSQVRVTLTNTGGTPMAIESVELEITHSHAPPRGTLANQYSQGAEGLSHFGALLTSAQPGSGAAVYEMSSEDGAVEAGIQGHEPYFNQKYVRLQAMESYPVTLTVQTGVPEELTYRVVARGTTARGPVTGSSGPLRIVGEARDPYSRLFARYYTRGHDPHACTATPANPWVDSSPYDRSRRCPYGLGLPYEAPPLAGLQTGHGRPRLALSVVTRKMAQAVRVDGVMLGGPPAGGALGRVVPALVRRLGPWTSCWVYSPTVHYWTANWQSLETSIVFRGGPPCALDERAHAVVVREGRAGSVVDTDLGRVGVGRIGVSPALKRKAIDLSEGVYGRRLVLAGFSPCAPMQVDVRRTAPGGSGSAGILTVQEEAADEKVDGVEVVLPQKRCDG